MKNKKYLDRGFTLIELLVVIAIIGILSSVVLASLSSARGRATKTSALATLRSVMPELVTCTDSAGFARTNITANPVCATAVNGASYQPGHSIAWPALPTGWTYVAPTGALAANDYVYSAADSATVPVPATAQLITCTVSTSSCVITR